MKRFCEVCNKETPSVTELVQETRTVRGITFFYYRTAAYCDICGIEVYDPTLHDAGVEACQAAYFAAVDAMEGGSADGQLGR